MKKINLKLTSTAILATASLLLCLNHANAQNSVAPENTSAKSRFGFRVGLNYARVSSDADSIRYQYKPGLMVAVFLTPHTSGKVGFRNEVLYSRQGFQYTTADGKSGTVSNDYIMLPQMMTVNITKYVQLQAGAFAGYLLSSKNSDGSDESSAGGNDYLQLMSRIDYGAGGGIEIHPFKGLIINARYNMGFAKLYKENDKSTVDSYPQSFLPFQNIDTKNAVIQFSAGYQF